MSSSSRPFSTASPVHPNYLPTLHKSGRMEKKLVAATVAAVGVGYGIAKYKQSQTDDSRYLREAAEKRRQQAMMDAYGDRGTLEELQAAVSAYESHRKN